MSNNYPSDWDSRRREVYERDGYMCQNCGRSLRNRSDLELHAHHIVPISKGGSHAKTNLSTMCSECHDAIHNDQEAPTAYRMPQTTSELTNYQDVFEILMKISQYITNNAAGHIAVSKDSVDIDQILAYYDTQRESVQTDIHEYKRNIASFDPYDNADSDHVQDDFKEEVERLIDVIIVMLDEFLELDRLLVRYVEKLTTVECPGCGVIHSESTEFCGECGTELPVLSICPECGKPRQTTHQNYCQGCGGELNSYPKSWLEQIETTKKEHEKKKESMNDTREQIGQIAEEEVQPLWERELS